MSYKSILVQVDESPRCVARIDAALDLAKRFEAHLTALAMVQPVYVPHTARTFLGDDFERHQATQARERAQRVLAVFGERARIAGATSVETRSATGDPVYATAFHARYHDLAIIGQADPDDDIGQWRDPGDFQGSAVLGLSRPVLVIPYAGKFETIGRHIVVAWDAGREAARAVTDALPMLKRAQRVTLLVINAEKAGSHGAEPGADIALFLARHDVKVEVAQEHSGSLDVGNFLLSRLADSGADLLVMGAYGHSRLRELVLGGMTRTILDSMTIPVLMSH